MDGFLPYSYIATRPLQQFVTVLDDICMRIVHTTGEAHFIHLRNKKINLFENPYQPRRVRKAGHNFISADVQNRNEQMADMYEEVIVDGAAVVYERCKAELDPYLVVTDHATYANASERLDRVFSGFGYSNGEIDPVAFCKGQGLHENFAYTTEISNIIANKKTYCQEEENTLAGFQAKTISAAKWMQTHLFPHTSEELDQVQQVKNNIFLVDVFTNNLSHVTLIPSPGIPNKTLEEAGLEGRLILARGVQDAISQFSPDAPAGL